MCGGGDSDGGGGGMDIGGETIGDNTSLGGGGDDGDSGTTYGVNGVSKTGSTDQDASIGFTSSSGSGTAGSNYDALSNASTSTVDQAIDMANQGATVSQIGDMLTSSQGTNSIAGSSSTGSTAQLFSGGKTISGYDVDGNPTYSSARTTTAPSIVTNTVADATGNTIGAGFSTVTDTLADDDFNGVSGYDNSSKIADEGMTFGPNGFGPPDLDPFGGRGASVQSLTDLEGTGFSSDPKSASFGGGLIGGSVVETDKKDLDIATIAPGYGRDFGMNLGQFMNTPNMAGVTPTQAMSTSKDFGFSNYAPYSNISSKAGGQAPTYGVSLADYSFNKDGTVTGRFSGQNEGFFGSPVGGVFGMLTGMPAIKGLNTVGSLVNSTRKGTFSTVSNMIGLVNPTAGALTGLAKRGAEVFSIDLDAMMGLGANQGYMSQTSPSSSSSGGDDNSINAPVSSAPKIESSTNDMRQIDRPDTMPTDLLRRKRRAGQDVYGVSDSSPFLNYSDDIDTSGMGSYAGKSRSGQFKSAPTGR